MLTRRDTQGVMSCELVTYGIALITSDLPICHEIFDGVINVSFVNNDALCNVDISIEGVSKGTEKYNSDNTIGKEMKILSR